MNKIYCKNDKFPLFLFQSLNSSHTWQIRSRNLTCPNMAPHTMTHYNIYKNSGKISSLCSWRDYYARDIFVAAEPWRIFPERWIATNHLVALPPRTQKYGLLNPPPPQKKVTGSGVWLKLPLLDMYLRKGHFTFAYLAGFLKTLP